MRTIQMVCPGCGSPEPILIEIERDSGEWDGWTINGWGDCPTCGPAPRQAVEMRLEHEVDAHGAEWDAEDGMQRVLDTAEYGRRAYRRALADYRREYGR